MEFNLCREPSYKSHVWPDMPYACSLVRASREVEARRALDHDSRVLIVTKPLVVRHSSTDRAFDARLAI